MDEEEHEDRSKSSDLRESSEVFSDVVTITASPSIKIAKLWFKNFKSLRDVVIDLRQFNLLVGPNSSGKSNIIEAIKLFQKIIRRDYEHNPFAEWWGYNNVVWKRDEKLDITFGMELHVNNYNCIHEITFNGRGGKFEILDDKLVIKDVCEINNNRDESINIKYNKEFIDNLIKDIEKIEEPVKFNKTDIISQLEKLKLNDYTYKRIIIGYITTTIEVFKKIEELEKILISQKINKITLIHKSDEYILPIPEELMSLRGDLSILNVPPNIIDKGEPEKIKKVYSMDIANSLATIFHNLLLPRDKRAIVERICKKLSLILNRDIEVEPTLTDDLRIFIKIVEKDLELIPKMVSDGTWKLLIILTMIQCIKDLEEFKSMLKGKPVLLLIDEIENSLHPKTIEYIIDELKNSKITVIATTHSPAVVDIVEPEDLLIVSKDDEGATHVRRIEDVNKIKKKLTKYGITLSEGWLYGKVV